MTNSKITLQQIFDAAWQRFIVEEAEPCTKKIAGSKVFSCVYRGNGNSRCAVGLVLPDELLDETEDTCMNFRELKESFPSFFDIPEDTNLSNFQMNLHDSYVNPFRGDWIDSLKERKEAYLRVAEEYNLTIPAAKPKFDPPTN
jgi:hypothetical protein